MGMKSRKKPIRKTHTAYVARDTQVISAWFTEYTVSNLPLESAGWLDRGDHFRPTVSAGAERYIFCKDGWERLTGLKLGPGETAELHITLKRTPSKDYKKEKSDE